jgi:hypothetical protein
MSIKVPQFAGLFSVSSNWSPPPKEFAVLDVKRLQVWDVRENEKAPWREAEVIKIRRDEVVFQFLDMPNAPYVARS